MHIDKSGKGYGGNARTPAWHAHGRGSPTVLRASGASVALEVALSPMQLEETAHDAPECVCGRRRFSRVVDASCGRYARYASSPAVDCRAGCEEESGHQAAPDVLESATLQRGSKARRQCRRDALRVIGSCEGPGAGPGRFETVPWPERSAAAAVAMPNRVAVAYITGPKPF